MILDTNALSAYLDRTPEVVAIVSDADELAIPVIVAGEFAFGIPQSRHRALYERSLQRMLKAAASPFQPMKSGLPPSAASTRFRSSPATLISTSSLA